ncbi:MAG TPA: pseudaminic acid cytidylyltransferase [Oligoflexia bacterium]|nr:pseudaminic acid cytidylyltransferase [Oligoflexia bacterium]HMP48502.1 pseudaminic acid cytidylyltransferase [Oligoflexia bacterium]
MSKVAIITARKGSKRIPNKNIKMFLGSPIIKYSITAAIESGVFDEVMVSTDDEGIATIAKSYGAKVPFMRSEKNSNDFAGTADVLIEVIESYASMGIRHESLCGIYPTAPFITPQKLVAGMNLLQESHADVVLPVVRFSYPIQRSLKRIEERVEMFWPENYHARSQDLEPAYHDAGQFYCIKVNSLMKERKLFMSDTRPLVMSELEVQDIDNEDDWKLAEIKYSFLHHGRI